MTKSTLCFLIDDDEDDQEVFRMALSEIDKRINCITANDGVEAMTILGTNASLLPDFIFIDVNMPKMNGMECLAEIRQLERMKDAAVFMYSTTSDQKLIAQSKSLGATDFIVKPSGLSALTEKLTEVLLQKENR